MHTTAPACAGGKAGATTYVCSDCGADSPKWAGQCPACHAWDTLKLFRPAAGAAAAPAGSRNVSPRSYAAAATAAAAASSGTASSTTTSASWLATRSDATGRLVPLRALTSVGAPRTPLASKELNRVLGGGVVAGGVTLLAGSPGVGKSTLLLQLAAMLTGATTPDGQPYSLAAPAASGEPKTATASPPEQAQTPPVAVVAYISGEESAAQIKARAERLRIDAPGLLLMNETRVEDIVAELDRARGMVAGLGPGARLAGIIVDSIQTMFTDAAPAAAGTVTQVREAAVRLAQYARATATPLLLVGHVTKSGDIAGPRVLEHMVDTVVAIEADDASAVAAGGGSGGGNNGGGGWDGGSGGGGGGASALRILRTTKNRFGSTSEVGLFAMTDTGYREANAATAFLSATTTTTTTDDATPPPAGCAVTVALEGSRPLCVELQALATRTPFPLPRHRASGFPLDRAALLLAVLSRHAGLRTGALDIYVNVAGGLRLAEPAADAALCLALASAVTGRPVRRGVVALGEVGLTGELRAVPRLPPRLAAAAQLGFTTAVVPAASATEGTPRSMRVVPCRTIADALRAGLGDDWHRLLRSAVTGRRPAAAGGSGGGSGVSGGDDDEDDGAP